MNVIDRRKWQIKVHDSLDGGDVQPSCCKISGYKNTCFAAAKGLERGDSVVLRHPRMQTHYRQFELFEIFFDELTSATGGNKYDTGGRGHLSHFEKMGEICFFHVLGDEDVELSKLFDGAGRCRDLEELW